MYEARNNNNYDHRSEDPVEGVPFKLTVNVSEEAPCSNLSEEMALLAKMESIDWDSFEYDFKLERSVLEECNSKIQHAMMSLLINGDNDT